MKYRIEIQKRPSGNYYLYRADYREDGKVKSKRIYIGEEKQALKIIADITGNTGVNEKLIEFSGPLLLDYIAQKLKLSKIINKSITANTEYDAGLLLQLTLMTRVLHPESKYTLAKLWLEKSYLFEKYNFAPLEIYENLIYQYMDYLHPHLLTIQKELVKNIFKNFSLQSDELLFDGTSFKSFGLDEKDNEEEDLEDETDETYRTNQKEEILIDQENPPSYLKPIKRLHGYARDKRKDLAQINYMLGINGEYVPFYFELFSGNVADVEMFLTTLKRLQKEFPFLLTHFKHKFILFDKGNWNDKVLKNLKKICTNYDCCFIAAIRSSLIDDQIATIDLQHGTILIENNYGALVGQVIDFILYREPVKCLVYKIPVIASKDRDDLEKRISSTDKTITKLENDKSMTVNEFYKEIKSELRKNKLSFYYTIEKPKNGQETRPQVKKKEEYTKTKLLMCGVFVLATNNLTLSAEKMYSLYHSKNVVEQSFHLYKDLFEARNVFHSRSDRIETHFSLVSWGFMLVSLLKSELARIGLNLSFEQLLVFIKGSFLSKMDFIYPEFKSYTTQRVINLYPELQNVFKSFGLSFDLFSIDVLPTVEVQK